METDRKWVLIRIDGKIAAISNDYRALARIAGHLTAPQPADKTGRRRKKMQRANNETKPLFGNVSAVTVGLEEILQLKKEVKWEDLMLFGTEFQKKVWKTLWELTHSEDGSKSAKLLSYSDFAGICDNPAGVRAVAHAISLNPIPILIPCHLVVPKESIDRIREIRRKAEVTIFKGEDLCLSSILSDPAVDFGEYSLGKSLKRQLITSDLG